MSATEPRLNIIQPSPARLALRCWPFTTKGLGAAAWALAAALIVMPLGCGGGGGASGGTTPPPAAPTNTAPPTISGTAQVGQPLAKTNDGTWTGAPTFAYQWRRCSADGTGCVDVATAAGSSYTPVSDDIGHTLRLQVTGTNGGGSVAVVSDPTPAVVGTVSAFAASASSSPRPQGLVMGPDFNLWFTQRDGNRIGRMSVAGALLNEYALPTGSGPTGITRGSDGNLWFTESGTSKIGRITPGGTLTEFSVGLTAGSGPNAIVAGPDGALWFTERNANKLGCISTSGVITEYPWLHASGGLNGITVGPDGALWFTDTSTGTLGAIDPTSHAVAEYTWAGHGGSVPLDLTRGPDGNVWFTEQSGNRIGRITPAGVVTEFSTGLSTGCMPAGITLGPDGNLWFTERNTGKVGRITPGGVITEFTSGGYSVEPLSLLVGPDNNLWFTDFSSHRIDRLQIADPAAPITISTLPGKFPYGGPSGGLELLLGTVVTAPPGHTVLSAFTFDLEPLSATGTFTLEVYAWNGTQATGPALFTSAPFQAHTTFGLTSVTPGTLVTPGNQYVLATHTVDGAVLGCGQSSNGLGSALACYGPPTTETWLSMPNLPTVAFSATFTKP